MKRILTFVFLCVSFAAIGQKALSGTLVLQDNFIQFNHVTDTAEQKVESYYKPSQFPTFSFSFLKFRETGGYMRFYLSGWQHTKIDDFEFVYSSNGTMLNGGGIKLLSGRIGYARGMRLSNKNEKHSLFLETDLNAGFQYNSIQPKTIAISYRTIWAAYTRLGINFIWQRNYKNGFFRLIALLPALQINTEHYSNIDPVFPSVSTETNKTYLDTDALSRKGLEIGGGFYFSK